MAANDGIGSHNCSVSLAEFVDEMSAQHCWTRLVRWCSHPSIAVAAAVWSQRRLLSLADLDNVDTACFFQLVADFLPHAKRISQVVVVLLIVQNMCNKRNDIMSHADSLTLKVVEPVVLFADRFSDEDIDSFKTIYKNLLDILLTLVKRDRRLVGGYVSFFMETICADSGSLNVTTELLNLVNRLLEHQGRSVRSALRLRLTEQINFLVVKLKLCGDYDVQCSIVECLFRMSCSVDRKQLAVQWFPGDTDIGNKFVNIKDFEGDCRLFLNAFNGHLGADRLVHSFPAVSVLVGQVQLRTPPDYSELWVDINEGSRLMFMYCDHPTSCASQDSDSSCDAISLKVSDVDRVRLHIESDCQVVTLVMTRYWTNAFQQSTIKINKRVVQLTFRKDFDLHSVLNRVYIGKYKFDGSRSNMLSKASVAECPIQPSSAVASLSRKVKASEPIGYLRPSSHAATSLSTSYRVKTSSPNHSLRVRGIGPDTGLHLQSAMTGASVLESTSIPQVSNQNSGSEPLPVSGVVVHDQNQCPHPPSANDADESATGQEQDELDSAPFSDMEANTPPRTGTPVAAEKQSQTSSRSFISCTQSQPLPADISTMRPCIPRDSAAAPVPLSLTVTLSVIPPVSECDDDNNCCQSLVKEGSHGYIYESNGKSDDDFQNQSDTDSSDNTLKDAPTADNRSDVGQLSEEFPECRDPRAPFVDQSNAAPSLPSVVTSEKDVTSNVSSPSILGEPSPVHPAIVDNTAFVLQQKPVDGSKIRSAYSVASSVSSTDTSHSLRGTEKQQCVISEFSHSEQPAERCGGDGNADAGDALSRMMKASGKVVTADAAELSEEYLEYRDPQVPSVGDGNVAPSHPSTVPSEEEATNNVNSPSILGDSIPVQPAVVDSMAAVLSHQPVGGVKRRSLYSVSQSVLEFNVNESDKESRANDTLRDVTNKTRQSIYSEFLETNRFSKRSASRRGSKKAGGTSRGRGRGGKRRSGLVGSSAADRPPPGANPPSKRPRRAAAASSRLTYTETVDSSSDDAFQPSQLPSNVARRTAAKAPSVASCGINNNECWDVEQETVEPLTGCATRLEKSGMVDQVPAEETPTVSSANKLMVAPDASSGSDMACSVLKRPHRESPSRQGFSYKSSRRSLSRRVVSHDSSSSIVEFAREEPPKTSKNYIFDDVMVSDEPENPCNMDSNAGRFDICPPMVRGRSIRNKRLLMSDNDEAFDQLLYKSNSREVTCYGSTLKRRGLKGRRGGRGSRGGRGRGNLQLDADETLSRSAVTYRGSQSTSIEARGGHSKSRKNAPKPSLESWTSRVKRESRAPEVLRADSDSGGSDLDGGAVVPPLARTSPNVRNCIGLDSGTDLTDLTVEKDPAAYRLRNYSTSDRSPAMKSVANSTERTSTKRSQPNSKANTTRSGVQQNYKTLSQSALVVSINESAPQVVCPVNSPRSLSNSHQNASRLSTSAAVSSAVRTLGDRAEERPPDERQPSVENTPILPESSPFKSMSTEAFECVADVLDDDSMMESVLDLPEIPQPCSDQRAQHDLANGGRAAEQLSRCCDVGADGLGAAFPQRCSAEVASLDGAGAWLPYVPAGRCCDPEVISTLRSALVTVDNVRRQNQKLLDELSTFEQYARFVIAKRFPG